MTSGNPHGVLDGVGVLGCGWELAQKLCLVTRCSGRGLGATVFVLTERERSELVDCLQFLDVESGSERFAGQIDKQLVGGMISWRRRKDELLCKAGGGVTGQAVLCKKWTKEKKANNGSIGKHSHCWVERHRQ